MEIELYMCDECDTKMSLPAIGWCDDERTLCERCFNKAIIKADLAYDASLGRQIWKTLSETLWKTLSVRCAEKSSGLTRFETMTEIITPCAITKNLYERHPHWAYYGSVSRARNGNAFTRMKKVYARNGGDDQDVELVNTKRTILDDAWMDSIEGAEVTF